MVRPTVGLPAMQTKSDRTRQADVIMAYTSRLPAACPSGNGITVSDEHSGAARRDTALCSGTMTGLFGRPTTTYRTNHLLP
jgi:hypothetical protein